MMIKRTLLVSLITLLMIFHVVAQKSLTVNEMKTMTVTSNGSSVSIHDPSVVYRNGIYYIWGSHLGVASSTNLIDFNAISATDQTFARPDGTRCDYNTAFN